MTPNNKTSENARKRLRKHPKHCSLVVYHTSLVLLVIGIVVTIVAISTCRLFHVYIYDHRKPAKFYHVHTAVGLFSFDGKVTWLTMEQTSLKYNLEITDSRWILAKTMTLIGLFAAILSLLVHLIFHFRKTNNNWPNILFEVCSILAAIITVLIGLSLAETEVEFIHDHGDPSLTKLLAINGLLDMHYSPNTLTFSPFVSSNQSDMSTGATIDIDTNTDNTSNDPVKLNVFDGVGKGGDFALFLTPPSISFFLLITADFLYLLTFLGVLIYFVRVCEKAEQERKRLHRAETTANNTV